MIQERNRLANRFRDLVKVRTGTGLGFIRFASTISDSAKILSGSGRHNHSGLGFITSHLTLH